MIPAANVEYIDEQFDARLGDEYDYGCCYSPTDVEQGCDCSGLVGWVLEGYTKGPDGMNWQHDVSTEFWPYDYSDDCPVDPGTVGPYGTIAIASPSDMPSDAALLICIHHGGGGVDSHVSCSTGPAITPTPLAAPAGKIMESNGGPTSYPAGDGTCTNGTGGMSPDDPYWTDFWYLPGPIDSTNYVPPQPPPAPAAGTAYTVQSGDTLSSIADQLGVSLSALEAANPQITDPDSINVGELVNIP
jgi:LysM repeat protein